MKKILSLLSMLMITVMAFATDYKGQLDYTVKTRTSDLTGPSIAQGTLKIEDYAGGKYTVTATGCDLSSLGLGNWDEIICEGVEATTDANGVTTIDVTPYAYRSSDYAEFKSTKLFVKFKGDKAYATFEGTYAPNSFANYTLKYTFGTDEGFEGGGSTGGGETGGEVAAAFEKVNFVGDGTNFDWKIPVNWDTQKIVMSINPSTCTGGCEDIIGLGEVATAWDNTLHLYRKTDGTLQGYFQVPGGSNNNTNPFDETNPIKVEVSKAKGFVVNDVVKIPASEMSALFALSTVNMGTGEGANDKSRATYNYVKVVDKVWTEVPPVTVVDTKEFKNVAYTTSMGGNGTATVTFTEMSDGTFPMTFVSDDLNVKAENLTKGTDEKGRTTYTGTAKRTDVDVTFTVKAVVYGETTAQKLYMTMDNGSSLVVTVGEDPDYVAPVTYKNTLKVVRGTDTKAYENAEVSVLAKGENKYAVTIPSFTDMDQMEGTIGKLTFEATGVEDGGTLKLTATSAATTQEGGSGWDNAGFTASMDATVTDGTLAGTFTVVYPNDATNYTYTLYYGVEPPVAPDEPKDVTVVEKYQADGTGFAHNVTIDWDTQKIVASMNLAEAGSDKNIFAVAKEGQSADWVDYGVVFYDNGDGTVSGFVPGTDDNSNTSKQSKGSDPVRFEVSKDGVKFQGNVVIAASSLSNLISNKNVVVGAEGSKPGKAYYNYIKVVSLDWKEPTEPTEPEVTEVSNNTYTSNLRIFDGEEPVVEAAEAKVNIIKYSDESYKVTLKDVNILNKTQDLVFVGKALIEEAPTEATEPLTIIAKSDEATTTVFGEQVNGTFEITEVSADEIKMGFSMESQNFSYQGEFNYTEEEEPEVYTSNLHIYDAAAPETDLFQADQAKVEFLATETGEFKLTLKNVTLNEKTQDLVFTGALPTPQPGGQDPLAEEGEGEVTPAEPAMVLNATADEATATFLGTTSATAVFNVIMNDEAETENDAFALTFTITAGEKTLGGEFNYKKKTPDTPDPELFCKENYVADGEGFEWDINVDWDTQKIVMSIDPSTCTGSCEDVIGLGAVPTAWDNTLHLYRTSADQMLQGYFQTSADNNNTGKFAETTPFLVEVSKAQGFVVNNEVKIASSAMSYLFTLSTVKMGTGEGVNDKSRATYNYVKVVDKDWTAPKDPDTGINATTVAEGEVEFFTVNGVKLNKLQKGLNIVRTADGKVKKVLVK